jgi:hypothetical protein
MNIDRFGRYEIKSEVGRGGMATVYHAYDPRFERDVAIKVLPQALLHDPQFRTRFEREAKTIAHLEHPSIVPVYDFGEEQNQPYIVMRYMSGGSLSERLVEGAVSPDEAAQIISRLATALDAAHARGVIHRDLKPGNILFDQYGNAFLSDFGIARLLDSSMGTLTGESIVGTPAYMSPEQIQGDKTLDGRADIYSLGVILYQLLVGAAPYRADTPAKVMMMHILEPVPDLQTARRDLPPALASVVNRAMAKDPNNRFGSAGEMSTALQAALTGLATQIVDPRVAAVSEDNATIVRPVGGLTEVGKHAQGATPLPAAPRRRSIPLWGMAVGAVIVILLLGSIGLAGGLAMQGLRGFLGQGTPTTEAVAFLPTDTPELVVVPTQTEQPTPTLTSTPLPTDTPEPVVLPTEIPTDTPEPPTDTPSPPTETPTPLPPVIGGADKVAFLNANDVWVANLDGSELTRLTEDGGQKWNLQWSPDGESLIFISGKCARSVRIDDKSQYDITCIDVIGAFNAFQISPDGSQVALSLDREMYLVNYDLERLKTVRNRNHLLPLAPCSHFAPYSRLLITRIRWSNDGERLAVVYAAPEAGRHMDTVRLMEIKFCTDPVRNLDNFPAQRFEMSGYRDNPIIQNFGWDGEMLYSLVGYTRNDGFGDMYIYNQEVYRADARVNPINGRCCYRDVQFSPDGRYLFFAYQDVSGDNRIQLYYVMYGSIGTGVTYQPIPLPEEFFAVRNEKPQPVLRPAR